MLPWSVSFSSRVRINFTFCNQIEFPLRPWRKNPTYLVTSRVEAHRWSGKAPWSNICFDLVIRFKVRIQPWRTGNLRRRYVGPYMTRVKWRQIWKKMPSCVLCDGEVFDCIDGLYYCQSCGTQSQVTTSSFSFVLKCLSRSIQALCFTVAHNCHGANKYLTANSTTKPKSSGLLQLEWNCPFSCLN